jgi:hypothetical protein
MNIETKVFKESASRSLKIVSLVFLGIILLLAIPIAIDGFKDLVFLLLIAGIFLFVLLITFLVTGFAGLKKLECNSIGCEISYSNFWKRYLHSDSFEWASVTDTNIEEICEEVGKGGIVCNYFFEVTLNDQQKRIWNLTMSSKKTTSELFDYINKATPHLKYIWEKTADFGKRQVIVQVDDYCKVARM